MPAKITLRSKYLSRIHAAREYDCSIQLIDKMIKAGSLPNTRKFRRKVVILRADLEAQLRPYEPEAPRNQRVAELAHIRPPRRQP